MINKNVCLKFNNINNSLKPYKNKKLVVAVSGGVDSMCLLHFLVTEKYQVVVTHFNHHKRKNAIKEQALVENFCRENAILCYVFDINITDKNDFQMKARNMRYQLLKEVCLQEKTNIIVTAHHLSDQCETILMKLTRGMLATTKLGMQFKYTENNFTFLKPFLSISKDEIKSYQQDNNVLFLNDESNFENNYTRNRMRNLIIPILTQDNLDLNNTINNFSNYHDQLVDFVYQCCQKLYKKCVSNNSINFNIIKNEPNIIKIFIISIYLTNNNIIQSVNLIKDILKAVDTSKNIKLKIKNNLHLLLNYNILSFSYDNENTLFNNYQLAEYCPEKIENNKIYYSHNQIDHYFTSGMIKYNNNVVFPLNVRQFKPGDKLQFQYGTKKLSRFFIDKKIAPQSRKTIPIVVDSKETILWIPHYYLNQELKGDKILYLYLTKDEKDK